MNNLKRNVHKSGPLGMLLNRGMVTKIEENKEPEKVEEGSISTIDTSLEKQPATYYLDKNTGITFKENELLVINPDECEPWEYANRMHEEMGNIDELAESIRTNHQLQPILIRQHPTPHGKVKYQIIFGRRRHIACAKLGISLIAIKKDNLSVKEAIATQDAENRSRKNVSNYSNALLYKKLLQDGIFKEEKEIAEKIGLSKSSFSELMSYTKIPNEIINNIPDIHAVSNRLALEIVSLLKKSKSNYETILALAPKIGVTITSAEKLQKAVNGQTITKDVSTDTFFDIQAANGTKIFTYNFTSNGGVNLKISREIGKKLNQKDFCEYLKKYLGQFVE